MGLRSRCCAGVLLALGAAAAASATVRAVAPGELPAALVAAAPGDTLRLLAGVHRGPLLVDRQLEIIGESTAGEPLTIVEGSGRGTVLTLAADGIVVSNLLVRGSGTDLSQDDAAILLRERRQVTIRDCRIEAPAFGIYLRAGGQHRIVGNVVTGDDALAMSRRGNGIHLWYTQDNEVRGNRVARVRDGIYLSFAHDNLIEDNEGTGLRYGIHYMYSERNRLVANRFEGCTGGIALMFSLGNEIVGNEAIANQRFGILCQQLERSRFLRNRVSGNGRGFYLENSANNHFEGNRMASNGVGAYLTAGSEQNVFTANVFTQNLVQVYRDHGGVNRWSYAGRGNAWSDYLGVDWDRDGVGDVPYRLETASSALLARRPSARWLWMSPLLLILDWWESRTAVPAATDLDPEPLLGEPEA